MVDIRRQISLGFHSKPVTEGQHICYIFNDDDERRQTMARFLTSGLQLGEKLLYLVDTMSPGEFSQSLRDLGLDIEAVGQDFVLEDALPVYCPEGEFAGPNMCNTIRTFYDEARSDGFPGARGTAEMTWALRENGTSREQLMRYEATLNRVLETHPLTACCQYDARRFDGATIMDVLNVHPVMIVRGQLVENPYYVQPETFLQRYGAFSEV